MSSKAIITCVLRRFGGAIWWMLARWRPAYLIVLLAKTWRRLFLAAYPHPC